MNNALRAKNTLARTQRTLIVCVAGLTIVSLLAERIVAEDAPGESALQETGNSLLGFVSNALPSSRTGDNQPARDVSNASQPADMARDEQDASILQRQRMQFELERRKQSSQNYPVQQASATGEIHDGASNAVQLASHQSKQRASDSKATPAPLLFADMPGFTPNLIQATNGQISSQPPASPLTGKPDPIDLPDTLKRIGFSTFLVLAGCCAMLVIGKRFGLGQSNGQSNAQNNSQRNASDNSHGNSQGSSQGNSQGNSLRNSHKHSQGNSQGPTQNRFDAQPAERDTSSKIEVLESRVLHGRCQLKLIAVDNCRFLVALDGGGVKSMQAVTQSFPATFADITPEEIAAAESATQQETQEQSGHATEESSLRRKFMDDEELGRRLTSLIERL